MNAFFVRYIISLVYGLLMTYVFANISIKEKRKDIFGILGVLFVIEVILYLNFGVDYTLKTYPLHTHLLLVLMFTHIYKIQMYNSVIYVLLSYMSCQIPAWFSKFTMYLCPGNKLAETIAYCIFTITTGTLLYNIVGDSVKELLNGHTISKVAFGIIPITYYFFDYGTTLWTGLLYSGNYHVTQFIPLVLCIGYPIFIIVYHNEQKLSQQALQDKLVIEGNLNMIEGEIKDIQEIEMMSRIYRHDMRHHLLLLQSLIKENKLDEALGYITENINAVSEVTPERYCDLDILNLVLTHYGDIAKKNQIPYNFDINFSDKLPISNMEICALVSNALDNACQANLKVPEEARKLELVFKEHNGMLIFSVDNAYLETEEGTIRKNTDWDNEHGFGTKSIEAIAKKYNGEVRFSTMDGIFSTMVLMQKNI